MRLRFSTRDLLWLTLVVALAVGWWLEHRRQSTYEIWEIMQSNGTTTITNRVTGQYIETLYDGQHRTATGPLSLSNP
jgi:hypothetical protein